MSIASGMSRLQSAEAVHREQSGAEELLDYPHVHTDAAYLSQMDISHYEDIYPTDEQAYPIG